LERPRLLTCPSQAFSDEDGAEVVAGSDHPIEKRPYLGNQAPVLGGDQEAASTDEWQLVHERRDAAAFSLIHQDGQVTQSQGAVEDRGLSGIELG
jgi:hypothetical protein